MQVFDVKCRKQRLTAGCICIIIVLEFTEGKLKENKLKVLSLNGVECAFYSDDLPKLLLVQPVAKGEIIDTEIKFLKEFTDKPFALAAFEVDDWNASLSPWAMPPDFAGKASDTLAFIENTLLPQVWNGDIPAIIGGYSLAGLFALWAAYVTDRFAGVAAVSPSVWFEGWADFSERHLPKAKSIYLSLGRKEEKTRSKIMSAVGDNIRRQYKYFEENAIHSTLEWNDGGHFREPEKRTAKGFAWCIENFKEGN